MTAHPLLDALSKRGAQLRLRLRARALFDAIATAAVLATLGLWGAAQTGRGDVAAWTLPLFMVLGSSLALLRGLFRAQAMAGSLREVARTTATRVQRRYGFDHPAATRARDRLAAAELLLDQPGPLAEAFASRVAPDQPSDSEHAEAWEDLLSWRGRALFVGAALLAGASWTLLDPAAAKALQWTLAAEDARPAPAAAPLWASIRFAVTPPAHTGLEPVELHNPTEALQVPEGSTIEVVMDAPPAPAMKLWLEPRVEELASTAAPRFVPLTRGPQNSAVAGKHTGASVWHGTFVVQRSTDLTALVYTDPDRKPARRSPTLRLEVRPDEAPDVRVDPPPANYRPEEHDTVVVRFDADDEYGFSGGELVYSLEDGETYRQSLPAPPGGRTWRGAFEWDLGTVPLRDRNQLRYWVEIRDNDPTLGPDGRPGNVGRSSTSELVVSDRQSAHAENIASSQQLRDQALEHLADRLTTQAFGTDNGVPAPAAELALGHVRQLQAGTERFVAALARLADTLSQDILSPGRQAMVLAGVHQRQLALLRQGEALLATLPADAAVEDRASIRRLLPQLNKHNRAMVGALEDDTIRIDDLVDTLLAGQLEALLAQVEAAQQKLIDLLEQARAGDDSNAAQIEQLMRRRKLDLEKVKRIRAQMAKQMGRDFMNLDAFAVMERLAQQRELAKQIAAGDYGAALQAAREQMAELRGLRDGVQQHLGESENAEELPPEERARMRLLRELSRLEDQQKQLRSATATHEADYRRAVVDVPLAKEDVARLRRDAKALSERLSSVNDAALDRGGRVAFLDAMDALLRLEEMPDDIPAIRAAGLTETVAEELAAARANLGDDDSEAGRLDAGLKAARKLEVAAWAPLPSRASRFDDPTKEAITGLGAQEADLRGRVLDAKRTPDAEYLPEPGAKALDEARQAMKRGARALSGHNTHDAVAHHDQALRALRRAIESLRRKTPPPAAGAAAPDASTETEHDRGIRDQVLDAMRQGEGLGKATKQYYEELLR